MMIRSDAVVLGMIQQQPDRAGANEGRESGEGESQSKLEDCFYS